MKIDNNILLIDDALNDENIDELTKLVQKVDIIQIDNDDLSSGVLQILWCSKKEIKTDSEFLSKFFDNVKRIEN